MSDATPSGFHVNFVAAVAHEVNRAYCLAMGDLSQPEWKDAPDWQRDSAIAGVRFHLANPDAGPDASHNSWMAQKVADGWSYGPVKDPENKLHPCMVPFEQLPREQQAKDFLFRAVVHAHMALPETALNAVDDLVELPKWKCHKEIHAAKIRAIGRSHGKMTLWLEGEGTVTVSNEYWDKHHPIPGGYYVVYEDGYQSFSPAAAFESGYTRV